MANLAAPLIVPDTLRLPVHAIPELAVISPAAVIVPVAPVAVIAPAEDVPLMLTSYHPTLK